METNILIQAGAILFSKDEPGKILWRSRTPVWKALIEVKDGKQSIL
jgi:predicted GH43/DUF377 family glycosyl hydrolase